MGIAKSKIYSFRFYSNLLCKVQPIIWSKKICRNIEVDFTLNLKNDISIEDENQAGMLSKILCCGRGSFQLLCCEGNGHLYSKCFDMMIPNTSNVIIFGKRGC